MKAETELKDYHANLQVKRFTIDSVALLISQGYFFGPQWKFVFQGSLVLKIENCLFSEFNVLSVSSKFSGELLHEEILVSWMWPYCIKLIKVSTKYLDLYELKKIAK